MDIAKQAWEAFLHVAGLGVFAGLVLLLLIIAGMDFAKLWRSLTSR